MSEISADLCAFEGCSSLDGHTIRREFPADFPARTEFSPESGLQQTASTANQPK
jgi:hypothetical protein